MLVTLPDLADLGLEWMKRWWNVCWPEEQNKKAGQIPGDVLGISCPLEEMSFYLYCIP